MSALPPKADIAEPQLDVRFVPNADQVHRSKLGAIRSTNRQGRDQRRWNGKAKRLSCLHVDDKFVGRSIGRPFSAPRDRRIARTRLSVARERLSPWHTRALAVPVRCPTTSAVASVDSIGRCADAYWRVGSSNCAGRRSRSRRCPSCCRSRRGH
jgi:hypothetical protein